MSDIQNLPPAVRQKLLEMGKSRVQTLSLRDDGWFADAVGSFVVGASYLLGGAPGSRKSGLATQVALDLARQGKRVLIMPTEEPADRVWERLLKMMDGFCVEDIATAMQNLLVERNPPSVEQLPNYVSSQILSPTGLYHCITLAVLDSVQGHGLVSAANPDRPKLSKNKHKTSDYLLSGILQAKQDDGSLVGVLCGRVGKKVRYYRHRRGRTGYQTGSVFNKVIHAETVENAVIDAVKATLLETANLREKLLAMIAVESQSAVGVDVDDLKRQRERLKKRTELIVAHLDEETLADARNELDKLKAQRRLLDEQIASTNASTQTPKVDAEVMADQMLGKIEIFLADFQTMPKPLLRDWLTVLVPKVVVDMETKAIKIHVQLPTEMLKSAVSSEKAMRLATTSASSSGCETHPITMTVLALIECRCRKNSGRICYECHHRAA